MKFFIPLLLLTLLFGYGAADAQMTVAIGDFENITGIFYLDTWKDPLLLPGGKQR